MEEELELRDIMLVIIKRWKLVFFIPLAAVIVSAVVSFFVLTPVYESSSTLMVLHAPEVGQEYFRSLDIQLSRQLVKTYGEIVQSRRVAEAAMALAEEDQSLSISELQKRTKVGLVKDTELIHITVAHEDPLLAAYWATLVTRAFMEEVVKIMRVENVNILDRALPPASPVTPRPFLNMAVAFVLGVMVALGLAFLLEYLDNTIKLPKDVINNMQLPVLAVIPDFSRSME